MTITVKATVAGVEQHNGKPLVKLDVPVFRGRYATNLYGLTPADLATLTPLIGQEQSIVLAADRPREAKDGKPAPDPRRPFNWFWSFVRIAGDDDPTPVDTVTMPPRTGRSGPATHHRRRTAPRRRQPPSPRRQRPRRRRRPTRGRSTPATAASWRRFRSKRRWIRRHRTRRPAR